MLGSCFTWDKFVLQDKTSESCHSSRNSDSFHTCSHHSSPELRGKIEVLRIISPIVNYKFFKINLDWMSMDYFALNLSYIVYSFKDNYRSTHYFQENYRNCSSLHCNNVLHVLVIYLLQISPLMEIPG